MIAEVIAGRLCQGEGAACFEGLSVERQRDPEIILLWQGAVECAGLQTIGGVEIRVAQVCCQDLTGACAGSELMAWRPGWVSATSMLVSLLAVACQFSWLTCVLA